MKWRICKIWCEDDLPIWAQQIDWRMNMLWRSENIFFSSSYFIIIIHYIISKSDILEINCSNIDLLEKCISQNTEPLQGAYKKI